ncbi:MAG TPA: flagellar biosynthetic protein FliR [Acidobacteriota bacterium]|nr:flagellar biosynthetic protein FliR [Acidobacteriota bacterium]HNB71756.1 flagellar biosynthetic protein FliR [Acidobacteriota bacterium]HNG93320.1 flagellar biosynthetic protein FliR [Acidobacteriota bacterium]
MTADVLQTLAGLPVPIQMVLGFTIILARVGGLVTFAPFWGMGAASKQIRVVFALILACVVAPVVLPKLPPPPTELLQLAPILIMELVLGCALGFVGTLVLGAFEIAAHVLTSQMGFTLATTIDPTSRAQTTALGSFAQMLGLIVFVGMNGHYWFLTAVVQSFDTLPPGGFVMTAQTAHLLLRLSADALRIGLALAAPVIIVSLMVEFMLAIAGRTVPQLQILLSGFPIKILICLWLILLTLNFIPGSFRSVAGRTRSAIARVLATSQ